MSSLTSDPREVVRRLIDEVMNEGQLAVIAELYTPSLVPGAQRWIAPFRTSFPDLHMEIRELLVVGDRVIGRFWCSGTHLGAWRGYPPTGGRFERIDEVYFFRIVDGRIVHAWGIEDTLARMVQLGLVQLPAK